MKVLMEASREESVQREPKVKGFPKVEPWSDRKYLYAAGKGVAA